MASLSKDKATGEYRVLFLDAGKRRTLWVGVMPKKSAERIYAGVESILTARLANASIDPETAAWIGGLSETMHARMVRVGLANPRTAAQVVTLGALLDRVVATATVKASTMLVVGQARKSLLDYFGADVDVASIGTAEADGWRRSLTDEGLARATVSKRVLLARSFFRKACRWRMLTENPFEGIRAGLQSNDERAHFVSRDVLAALLDACPNVQWRTLLGLCRFAGLRCPSEVGALRWADVSWDRQRLIVHSAKTAEHEGKGERAVPIVPELQTLLLAAFEAAEPGEEYVVPMARDPRVNLRTHFQRIIGRAGQTAWPRLFHNLRASFATELVERFPAHVVAAWAGHSVAIAERHYLQVRDAHFSLASGGEAGAHPTAQQAPAPDRTVSALKADTAAFAGVSQGGAEACETLQNGGIALLGFEPRTKGL